MREGSEQSALSSTIEGSSTLWTVTLISGGRCRAKRRASRHRCAGTTWPRGDAWTRPVVQPTRQFEVLQAAEAPDLAQHARR
jgi:hypothetical protein